MYKNVVGKLLLLLCVAAISLIMMNCGSSSEKDTVGLILNETTYRVQVNFIGVKIVELQAGQAHIEYELKKGNSYEFQVTVLDGADVLQVIDSLLYIPSNPNEQREENRRYHWIIKISGNEVPFQVTAVSYE